MFGLNLGATSSSGGATAYNFGNYILADGVNDKGDMATTWSPDRFTDIVVSFWFKSSGNGTINMIIGGSNTSDYIFLRDGGTPNVRLASDKAGNARRAEWNSINPFDNDWHHFYFYYVNPADVQLVYDGVNKGSGGANFNGWDIDILFTRGGNTFFTQGGIDDLIMDTRTGSVSEAQALYNSGAGANPLTVLGSTPDIWYKFDINNGDTTVLNDGLSSNDLTLSNFSGTYISAH
jgi:hypothetical protein